MNLRYDQANARLLVQLDGEIDHHTSFRLRSEIDEGIYLHTPRQLVLDFQNVSFMDSSGIGLIMGRYRSLQPLGGTIVLLRPAPHIKRILKLAGMEQLAAIQDTLGKETVQ